jgi:hypothetical protein
MTPLFLLRKKIDQRLCANEHRFEWSDIRQDLKAIKQVEIEENGKRFALRSEFKSKGAFNIDTDNCF